MKFAATAAAATVLATGVSAQVSSPLQLLQYASRLLTAECREAVTGLVTGSELSQCLQVNNLLPILNNANTSVIPNINDYLTGLCSADACNQTTIDNATETVTTACATDLSRFGISEGLVEFIMNAYPTAREVACLSTNDTSLLMANGTSMMSNASSSMNSTSNMTTFCPTALLYKAQDYLGVNLTNNYIDSLILGANATAYQEILAIPHNGSVIADFGCNDCVAAGLEIVIRDYPQLENLTFNLNASDVEEYTNYNLTGLNQTERDNTTWTVARLYEGFCDVDVLANSSLPASINSTAYNSTEESTTSSMMSSMMMSSASGSTATGAVASATSAIRSSVSSAVASATSLPAPVASATSAVASVLPVPSQVISAVGGAPSVPATPTKRWVKWE